MAENKDPKTRKWLLTINNPLDKGFTHDVIKDYLNHLNLEYWCLSDEIGEEGTYHTHIFMYRSNALRASTIAKYFPSKIAHRDLANGTCVQNRNYVFKIDKFLNSEKGATNLRDTHEEWGEMPIERQGRRNDLEDLYDMIKSGMSNAQIIEDNPQYMMCIEKIERARLTIQEDMYKSIWRDLYVEYIYGKTGAGKTRSIMEQYGYENVYRVTDYMHPFDSYKGQSVVIFEEFRSSLRIEDILKYLDGYPCELPARYMNKVACFTKVYIISNIELLEQYPFIQKEQIETWNAFLRRIHSVRVFANNTIYEESVSNYLNGFKPWLSDSPFDI